MMQWRGGVTVTRSARVCVNIYIYVCMYTSRAPYNILCAIKSCVLDVYYYYYYDRVCVCVSARGEVSVVFAVKHFNGLFFTISRHSVDLTGGKKKTVILHCAISKYCSRRRKAKNGDAETLSYAPKS